MISRRNRLCLGFVGVLAATLTLSGCAATGNWLRTVEQPLMQNNPQMALQALETSGRDADDAALYLVNKGILLRMAGDIEGSIEAFESAKPLITFQEATSITDVATSLTLTSGGDGYQPPAFEQVQLHFFQALNRLDQGDWEGARIEAMQIDVLLERRWEGTSPFGADAAARFLTGVIFEGVGERDNALIAYRKAYDAYKERGTVGVVPVTLQRRLLVLTRENGMNDEFDSYVEAFGEERKAEALKFIEASKSHGEVILVANTGLIPHRYEDSTTHMDPTSGKVFTMAVPGLTAPNSMISGVSLQQDGSILGEGEVLADLSVLADKTLDDELPGLIAKSIARNVVKNAGANQVEEQFGFLGGLVANVAAAATESADIRCWNTLPQHIRVVFAHVKPGTYENFSVAFLDAGTNTAITQPIERPVAVNPGAPTVLSVHRVAP